MKSFRWNVWNIEHIGAHGILPQAAEFVVENAAVSWPEDAGEDRYRILGRGPDGAYVHVVSVFDPPDVVYVIHAQPMNESEKTALPPEDAMKKQDRFASYRKADGHVDFDALPTNLKAAFVREAERAPGRPLSPAKRRQFETWRKRAVGRPRVGQGFQRWNVSLEKGFAKKVTHYAKAHGISRSRVLAEGAKLLLDNAA